jgi:hypothetical protein
MASKNSTEFNRKEIPLAPHYSDAQTTLVEVNGEPQHYINRVKKRGRLAIGATYYEPLDPTDTSISAIHYIPGLLTPEGGVAAAAGYTATLGYSALTHESPRRESIVRQIRNRERSKNAINYQGEGVVDATAIISETFGITKADWAAHSMGKITMVQALKSLEPGDPREPRSILGIAPAGLGQHSLWQNVKSHSGRVKGMYGIELRPHFGNVLVEAPSDTKRQFLRHIGSGPIRAVMETYATLATNIGPEDIERIRSRGIRVGRLDAENDQFVPPVIGNHINQHLDWRGEIPGGLHLDLMAYPLRMADEVIMSIDALNDNMQSEKVA